MRDVEKEGILRQRDVVWRAVVFFGRMWGPHCPCECLFVWCPERLRAESRHRKRIITASSLAFKSLSHRVQTNRTESASVPVKYHERQFECNGAVQGRARPSGFSNRHAVGIRHQQWGCLPRTVVPLLVFSDQIVVVSHD